MERWTAQTSARAGSPRAPGRGGAGSLRTFWRRVFEKPDPQLAHAGADGELLAAKIRAVLVLLILYIPLVHLATEPHAQGARVGLGLAAAALVQTLVVYQALHRWRHRHLFWVSCASSLLDVSLVTAALSSPLFVDRPATPSTLAAVFSIYLLALFATALRYDARICVVAGGAAVLQYAALTVVAARSLAVPAAPAAALSLGWVDVSARLILLAAATVLAAALVVRGRELRHLSTRDPLTGVLNRGFFEERLHEEAARLERGRDPVVCAMIDLDHFKRFNDTHGHAAGDAALQGIGRVLGTWFRVTDIVARYGGEEFAVVVPGLDPERGRERMEAIRRALSETPLGLPGGPATISVSIGLAHFPTDGATLAEVLEVADRRLYQAKQAGRDRVVVG